MEYTIKHLNLTNDFATNNQQLLDLPKKIQEILSTRLDQLSVPYDYSAEELKKMKEDPQWDPAISAPFSVWREAKIEEQNRIRKSMFEKAGHDMKKFVPEVFQDKIQLASNLYPRLNVFYLTEYAELPANLHDMCFVAFAFNYKGHLAVTSMETHFGMAEAGQNTPSEVRAQLEGYFRPMGRLVTGNSLTYSDLTPAALVERTESIVNEFTKTKAESIKRRLNARFAL